MGKNTLILVNMELVELWATQFARRKTEFPDIYAAGLLGLVMAAASFNPQHEPNFRTHAKFYIYREFRRERKFLDSLG